MSRLLSGIGRASGFGLSTSLPLVFSRKSMFTFNLEVQRADVRKQGGRRKPGAADWIAPTDFG